MLYQLGDSFVDIVVETPYKSVLTIRASSEEALKPFTNITSGRVVQVPHHIYTHIIHISEDVIGREFSWKDLLNVEKIERLTPEPTAFVYDYAYEEEDGTITGDYWFCWPHEIEEVTHSLRTGEKEILGDPTFIPIFFIPRELSGAPLQFNLDDEDGEITYE
jgi:hypothetical protein